MTIRQIRRAEADHIADLVRLRQILARYGASADELSAYDAEIARQRLELQLVAA
jgi:hypothetical protein